MTLMVSEIASSATAELPGTKAGGDHTSKDEADLIELALNAIFSRDPTRFDPCLPAKKAKAVVRDIADMVDSLPTPTRRTEEQEQFQQFSTPAHLAYIAAWVANLTSKDAVLEPSAGTGGLAVWALNAACGAVWVNELCPRRSKLLEKYHFTAAFRENAEQIHNVLPDDVQPSVVLMNPPFSRSHRLGREKNQMIATIHVDQALKRLIPGGRLVTILPGYLKLDGAAKYQAWWMQTALAYNVRAVVDVPGREYRKYGTHYETQIAVIDKTTPSGLTSVVRGEAKAAIDLIDVLDPIRIDRRQTQVPMKTVSMFDIESRPAAFKTKPANGIGVAIAPVITKIETKAEEPDAGPLTEAIYEPYTPQRIRIPGAKDHPTPLVQSAAMGSVLPPPVTYNPAIPNWIIEQGVLSEAQMEAVIYAGQSFEKWLPPMVDQESGQEISLRRGFFIGDGTGVGKGREICGIILDDFNRRKTGVAIWISKTRGLLQDAQRDWADVGGNPDEIVPLSKFAPSEPIPMPVPGRRRILFCTHATLRMNRLSTDKSRIRQVVEWVSNEFDGVIAIDEAHAGKNAAEVEGERGKKQASETAIAMAELQMKLPKAKVVYASATGATEVQNLGYLDRLGLWGKGTAFAGKEDFICKVESGGVAAMELVARDMKQMGMYLARNLSFAGVEYERLTHKLTPPQIVLYDKMCEGWQIVLQNFNAALELVASMITKDGKVKVDGMAKGRALSAFWSSHQRFFNQVLTAMQMPTVIKDTEKELKAGNCVVMQLVNTNEATMDRQLAALDEEDDLEELDLTPREILCQLVEHSFPVIQYEVYLDGDQKRMRPAKKENGEPVINKETVAIRERLLNEIGSLRVPEGPLEMILNHFGEKVVAEVTGRKRRVIRVTEAGQEKLVIQPRSRAKCLAEVAEFQNDARKILVFSDAGGTGASYHADKRAVNKQKRIHYLVQAGWVADAAVQGFGRTHRSYQAQPPLYKLVSTDIKGQMRFISTIARRLDQLGALTKGQRQAGSNGIFKSTDNLESTFAKDALRKFYEKHHAGKVEAITMAAFEAETGLAVRNEEGLLRDNTPPITRFLNRLLSMTVKRQNAVFDAYLECLEERIQLAMDRGEYDFGVETILADSVTVVNETVCHTDESGAQTKHVELLLKFGTHPKTYAQLMAGRDATFHRKVEFFARNTESGHVYAFTTSQDRTDRIGGDVVAMYRKIGPIHHERVEQGEINFNPNWVRLTSAQAKKAWGAQFKTQPTFTEENLHLVTGAVLPVWDRLRGNPKVKRLRTDDGRRLLGRVIDEEDLPDTLKALGIEDRKRGYNLAKVLLKLEGGTHVVELANTWSIKRVSVAKEHRLEIFGPDFRQGNLLKSDGVFSERINWKLRYFIPWGEKAAGVLAAVVKDRPIVEMRKLARS